MRNPVRYTGLCFAVLVSAVTPLAAADWPNFRGPNHDGISQESGLKLEWKQPIPFVWQTEVGAAFSSFACVGNRIYTGGTKDKQQVLYCLDADTGKEVWSVPFEPEYREPQGGDGPRATPTVSDGRIYMVGARGLFFCVDAETGKEHWRKQFNHVPQWGYSASVLIEGNMAITTAGMDQGSIVAFDKVSGQQLWKTGADPVGYATPYPFTFGGKRYVVGFTGTHARIVEAVNGREVWSMPWKTDWDVNAAQPIFHDDHLFLSSGYDTGSGVFKLRANGDKLAADQKWKTEVLLSKFQSSILFNGKLYGSDQNSLACVDFLTGKEDWRRKRIRNGTVVLVEDHLLLLTEQGQLQIGRTTPQGWSPITQAEILDDRCWSVPVLHRGKLYARNLELVKCFDLRAK